MIHFCVSVVGAKCTIGSKVRWQLGPLSCLRNDQASIVPLSQRLLAPFSSAGFHTDLQTTSHRVGSQGVFTWLPLNFMPTTQKWMRGVPEHGKLSQAVWQCSVRKICQDNEVKCDKRYQPWELCSFLGCLDLLLFHNAFKTGEILKACLRETSLTEHTPPQVNMEITIHCCDLVLKSIS